MLFAAGSYIRLWGHPLNKITSHTVRQDRIKLIFITFCRFFVLSFLGFLLVSCADSRAPINAINETALSNEGNRPSNAVRPSVPSAHPEKIRSNVVIENGRIVYNRNYENLSKGSYEGDIYTVKHGDTLFYVAWITNNDYRELAQRNGMSEPYHLSVGQKIKIGNEINMPLVAGNSRTIIDATQNGVPQPPSIIAPSKKSNFIAQKQNGSYSDKLENGRGSVPRTNSVLARSANNLTDNNLPAWRWPAQGKITESFSNAEGGNKGIDIAGSRGDIIFSAASGKVVYAGSALRGYGNLIIIKHNNDYLSAYAHNDEMFVKEQQDIKLGQKIATMGSSGTSSVRLHFEIRYKGKSVNPLLYLPQR